MSKDENVQYDLVSAFNDSLTSEIILTTTGLGEAALDSFLEPGIIKDIPLLSTVVSLFKIGHSVGDAFYIKKLATFINEINRNVIEAGKLEKYKTSIHENPKKFKKDIEFILVLINRFIDSEKSKYLAKLYVEYLEEKIDWKEFVKYSQVIDQLFNADLKVIFLKGVLLCKRKDSDDILRLESLGLLVEVNNAPQFEVNATGRLIMETSHELDEVEYELTAFGKTLADILR